jgi:ATP synthase F1 gamma subunit
VGRPAGQVGRPAGQGGAHEQRQDDGDAGRALRSGRPATEGDRQGQRQDDGDADEQHGVGERRALELLDLMDRWTLRRLSVLHNTQTRGFQYEIALRQLLPPDVAAPPGPRPRPEVKPAADQPALLTHLLTEYVLVGLYRAAVESAISEQLARSATTRMAVENARRLVDDLTLQCGLARQHAATQSLLEIVAGHQAAGAAAGPAPRRPGSS